MVDLPQFKRARDLAWTVFPFGAEKIVQLSFGADDPAGLMHGFDLHAWRNDIDHLQIALEAVAMMPGLVAGHACAGTRPKCSRDQPAPQPVHAARGGNGKHKVLIDETFVETLDRKGRVRYVEASELAPDEWPDDPITHIQAVPSPATRAGRYRHGAYCPLVYRPRPASLIQERAEYAAWRAALELLADELSGKLGSIAPLPPAAPWRPWAGEGERHGRPPQLFAGLRDEPYRRETRKQAGLRRERAKRRLERDIRAEQTRPVTMPAKGGRGVRGPGAA